MCDFGTGQVAERAWGEAGKFLGRVVCGTRAAGAQGLAASGWTLKTALVQRRHRAMRQCVAAGGRRAYGQITRNRITCAEALWSPSLPHQQPAQLHTLLGVKVQQSRRGAAFRCQPCYAPIIL